MFAQYQDAAKAQTRLALLGYNVVITGWTGAFDVWLILAPQPKGIR